MADLVKKINPHIEVIYYKKYFNKQDVKKVIKSNFIFFECDDSININEVRNILRNIILKYNIPVFDGVFMKMEEAVPLLLLIIQIYMILGRTIG